jgi:hypothetical protein
MRAATSVAPPGLKPTSIRTGFDGYAGSEATLAAPPTAVAAATANRTSHPIPAENNNCASLPVSSNPG